MKKLFFLVVLLSFLSCSLFSQEQGVKSKRDVKELLPKAGDFALIIDAAPFLDYAADVLSFDGGVSAVAPDFMSFRQDIMGKYFLEDDLAIRARLTVGTNNFSKNYYVQDDFKLIEDGDLDARVVDVWKGKKSDYEIAGGIEKRVGVSRVQGYVAAEIFMGITTSTDKYKYGNPITEANKVPSSTNMNSNVVGGTRTLYTKNLGNDFYYGLRGIVGVDFFITKNIALGGEISLMAAGVKGAKRTTVTEFWDVTQVTTKETLVSPGGTEFHVANAPITSLSLSFFF